MFPMFIIFFISALAETNRPPFDLPEAESELVAGYHGRILLDRLSAVHARRIRQRSCFMCAMTTILFLGGWPAVPIDFTAGWPPFTWQFPGVFLVFFAQDRLLVFFMIAMVKAFVPRYRYDQLMRLGWKVFLPISLVAVVVVAAWRGRLIVAAPSCFSSRAGARRRAGRWQW